MRFKFNKPFASGGAEAGKSFPASRKSMGLQTLFLICAASLLFIILYRRFLFGQAVYRFFVLHPLLRPGCGYCRHFSAVRQPVEDVPAVF